MEDVSFNRVALRASATWVGIALLSAAVFSPFSTNKSSIEVVRNFTGLFAVSCCLAALGSILVFSLKSGKIARSLIGLAYGWLSSFVVGLIYAQAITPRGEASAWYAMTTLPCVFFFGIGGAVVGVIAASQKQSSGE